jgi:hypothetical protein
MESTIDNPKGLTPSEAKAQFGATHWYPMRDGITPQMYYKKETTQLNNGKSFTCWVYLSYCDLWQGSTMQIGSTDEAKLIPIK